MSMNLKTLNPKIILIHILFFLFIPLYAQIEGELIIISERVGKEVDKEERTKFNLFDYIEGFQSATLIKTGDGKYFLKISTLDEQTNESKAVYVEQSEASIQNRKKYIDEYEPEQSEVNQEIVSTEMDNNNPGHALYIEMGGKPFFSLNMDFRINAKNRIGIAANFAPYTEGDAKATVYGPNVMYFYLAGETNRMEIGAGISVLPFYASDGDVEEPGTQFYLHGSFSYRYQIENGVLFRIGFTPLLELKKTIFLPMFGVSLGYSF